MPAALVVTKGYMRCMHLLQNLHLCHTTPNLHVKHMLFHVLLVPPRSSPTLILVLNMTTSSDKSRMFRYLIRHRLPMLCDTGHKQLSCPVVYADVFQGSHLMAY